MCLRQLVFQWLNDRTPSLIGKTVILIFLNGLAVILESVSAYQRLWGREFAWFEQISSGLFAFEYLICRLPRVFYPYGIDLDACRACRKRHVFGRGQSSAGSIWQHSIVSVTVWGKAFGVFITIAGLGMVALPASILTSRLSYANGASATASNFRRRCSMENSLWLRRHLLERSICPHCGKLLGEKER